MSGRMHARKCKDGSYRLRIYHAHKDQIETIQLALKLARSALGTEFDSVALDAICTNFLSTLPAQKSGGNIPVPD